MHILNQDFYDEKGHYLGQISGLSNGDNSLY